MASPKSLRLCSFFLILLAFCSTDWIIAVTLSASLLNLSSACSYLLLSLSTEFPEFWRSWFWSFLLLFFFPLMVERIFRGLCHFHWCQLFLVFKGIVFAMQVADISVCLAFSNDSGFCYFVWNTSISRIIYMCKLWSSVPSPILSHLSKRQGGLHFYVNQGTMLLSFSLQNAIVISS